MGSKNVINYMADHNYSSRSAKNSKKLVPKDQNRIKVYKIVKVEPKCYVLCYLRKQQIIFATANNYTSVYILSNCHLSHIKFFNSLRG